MSSETAGGRRQYSVGDLLAGRYRLEAAIGQGSLANVYRARNVSVDKLVAIKILRSEFVENEDIVERFLREGRLANRARHPNIVDVIDAARAPEGTPFLVQEFLEGESLEAHLHRHGGALSPDSAVDWLLPIVDAIAHAHECGVVHRDLKPENIFFSMDGDVVVPKVLDFGISKGHQSETGLRAVARGEPGATRIRETQTGVLLGSPAYMAPEIILQRSGRDARVDVWSLGVVFFEVLAGRLPFECANVRALFTEICLKDVAPLRQFAPAVPPALAEAVDMCLRHTPSERHSNAGEFAVAIRRAMGLPAVGRRRGEVPRSGWAPATRPSASSDASQRRLTATLAEVEEPSVGALCVPQSARCAEDYAASGPTRRGPGMLNCYAPESRSVRRVGASRGPVDPSLRASSARLSACATGPTSNAQWSLKPGPSKA